MSLHKAQRFDKSRAKRRPKQHAHLYGQPDSLRFSPTASDSYRPRRVTTSKRERPLPIILICLLMGFFWLLEGFGFAFISQRGYNNQLIGFIGFDLLLFAASIIGLWLIKKWGFWLLLSHMLFGIWSNFYFYGVFSPLELILPVIVTAFLALYYRDMK